MDSLIQCQKDFINSRKHIKNYEEDVYQYSPLDKFVPFYRWICKDGLQMNTILDGDESILDSDYAMDILISEIKNECSNRNCVFLKHCN